MSKSQSIDQIMEKIIKTFTPSEVEEKRIRTRFRKYDKTELEHLYKNFEIFGVEAVLECMVSQEKEKSEDI